MTIEVNEVEHQGLRLRLKETLRLQSRRVDGNARFLVVEDQRIALCAIAGKKDLVDAVEEDLVLLWRHYAQAPDETLSPKAIELKRRLRASMEEVGKEKAK